MNLESLHGVRYAFFSVTVGWLMCCGNGFAATEFHVSPHGSDANPGSETRPFKTLKEARDAVRKVNSNMTADIHVWLHGGTNRLDETVEFDQRDSGSNGHRVVYKSFEKEIPILSGGRRVAGWTLHDAGKKIYKAKAGGLEFRQVYVDGQRAVRAREPNLTDEATMGPYFRLASADDLTGIEYAIHNESGKDTKRAKIRKCDWDKVTSVSNIQQMEMVVQAHWFHNNLIYGSHAVEGDYVWFTPALPKPGLNKGRTFYEGRNGSSYFFANAYELLDADGEWYLDTNKDTLYYKPRRSEDMQRASVDVPVLATLVDIQGTKTEPVHDLEFEGVTFECSNWLAPSRRGLSATQFVQDGRANGEQPPGMIQVAHARRTAFRNGAVRNAGATGIQFSEDVDDSDIEGNRIDNIAANAMEIDEHGLKYDGRLSGHAGKEAIKPKLISQCENVAIWNNRITRAGRDYTNGGALLAQFVKGLIVEHNEISDMPYSGMQIGQQPGGYADFGCHDNKIRYNHIHHCMQTRDDGGAIYTLGGQQRGTIIADNYIHDVVRSQWAQQWHVAGIYLDNYTQYITITHNVIKNCTESAGQWNHAKDNTFVKEDFDAAAVIRDAGIRAGYHPRKTSVQQGHADGRVETATDLQERIVKQYPDSLWYKASGEIPKALEGMTLPLKRAGGPGAPASMDLAAKPALAGFHDQTIFVVYRPQAADGKGTLLKIGDPARDDHGLVIRENAVTFQNHTDFDSTFYRWKYDTFPNNKALDDPVLDTQKFFLYPSRADVEESLALPSQKDTSKYRVLAVRSDSLGKVGAFRIDVDRENASVLARGAKGKRIVKSVAERVALSNAGADMTPYYHTCRIPTIYRARDGRLIAAWEARRDSIGDAGEIDICYACSDDKGKTWSRAAILMPYGAKPAGKLGEGRGDMGNPCLGFEAKSGTVWLLFRRGDHLHGPLLCSKSTDNGRTWGFADGDLYKVITGQHYRPGPTRIIQIPIDSKSPAAGRMLLSTIMDQNGKSLAIWGCEAGTETWKRIAVIPNKFTIRKTGPLGYFVGGKAGDDETWPSSFDETTLFYCEANQTVYLSVRKAGWRGEPSPRPGLGGRIGEFGRAFLRSTDGGKTWSGPTEYYQYAIPQMQQSNIAYRDVLLWFTASGDHLKIFSLPGRSSFHCFASFDLGVTWDEALINILPAEVSSPLYKTLPYLGFGAYSTAVPVDDHTVGVLVERGSDWANAGERGETCYNLTFYPFKIRYEATMTMDKLKEIAKGRTDVFLNGKKTASFAKRSDINLLSTYETKGKLQLVVGAGRNAEGYQIPFDGEIAEVIVFDKALPDEEMALVNRYLEKQYR